MNGLNLTTAKPLFFGIILVGMMLLRPQGSGPPPRGRANCIPRPPAKGPRKTPTSLPPDRKSDVVTSQENPSSTDQEQSRTFSRSGAWSSTSAG
jgi:hypothetical protein